MKELDKQTAERIDLWLKGNYDEDTKTEIRSLLENEKYTELTDAFYTDLEFGTGGLRGIMGVGTNRINRYTVGMATQGFANYLKRKYPNGNIKVAIAYDNRNQSPELAKVTASIFSANNIEVYLYEELRPTPLLSFAVRELKCQGGVMLTASHNPKEYNGYKIYGEDGGQVAFPQDLEVIKEVRAVSNVDEIHFNTNSSLIHSIGKELDEIYLTKIERLAIKSNIDKEKENLTIVFSPVHGTAITMIPPALERWGFSHINIVSEQATPDGNFTNAPFPNPEDKEAFELSLKLASKVDADIVLVTDPDCDRVGVAVRQSKDNYKMLDGNQVGSLLTYYVLQGHKENGKLNGNEFVVKTIVSSNLITDIASSFNVKTYEVLTGFKYIAEKILEKEATEFFLVGGEESYGYLIGSLVRDKDAVIACAIISEMAAWYKSQGKTLVDVLNFLHETYGTYKEKMISITRKGKAGLEEISRLMTTLRENPPKYIGGNEIVEIKDYYTSEELNVKDGSRNKIYLPQSNVLQFITVNGDVISARPSGTEPKIKFYCSVKSQSNSSDVDEMLDKKINLIINDLNGYVK